MKELLFLKKSQQKFHRGIFLAYLQNASINCILPRRSVNIVLMYRLSNKLFQDLKDFYKRGTLWTKITKIIETPLFVNSQLTSMVQIADLCSYSLRRYLENGEESLFDLIFSRADRKADRIVGVRHYTDNKCKCKICKGTSLRTLLNVIPNAN